MIIVTQKHERVWVLQRSNIKYYDYFYAVIWKRMIIVMQ